jgi:hypothetical protein
MGQIVIDIETTGLDRWTVIASSRLERSNSSTVPQPARLFTDTYVRNATYRPTPPRCTGLLPSSWPTSRCLVRSPTSSYRSSAAHRSRRTIPALTSPSSMPSCCDPEDAVATKLGKPE